MTRIEAWQSSQCEQLIELCATPRSQPISWTNYLAFVRLLVDGQAAASILEWHHIKENYDGIEIRKPHIKTLVSLAAFQGVSVTEVLSAPNLAASRALGHPRPFNWIPPTQPMYEPKVMWALNFMRESLREGYGYIPPLDVVLKTFKVLRATVHEADPELFGIYKKQYAAQGSSAALAHVRRAFSEAVRHVQRTRARMVTRSRAEPVYKRMRQRLVDRQAAAEVTRAAFRLDDSYKRMSEY